MKVAIFNSKLIEFEILRVVKYFCQSCGKLRIQFVIFAKLNKFNNKVIMNIQLKSSIKCQTCSFTSSRFQTELCLHLPVPTDDQFVANFLIYQNNQIKECRISIPNKGKEILEFFQFGDWITIMVSKSTKKSEKHLKKGLQKHKFLKMANKKKSYVKTKNKVFQVHSWTS